MNDVILKKTFRSGELDTDYGDKGVCIIKEDVILFDMAEGKNEYVNSFYVTGATRNFSEKMKYFLARITPNGILDPDFSGGSILGSFVEGLHSQALSISTLSDGRILILGDVDYSYPGLARFNVDGTPDKTFGDNGVKVLDFLSEKRSADDRLIQDEHGKKGHARSASDGLSNIIVFPDGSMLIAYSFRNSGRQLFISLKENGDLDTRFQGKGYSDITIPLPAMISRIYGLGLQKINGVDKLVVSGYCDELIDSDWMNRGFFARYEMNGDPDVDFGKNGSVIVLEPEVGSELWGLDILDDGKVLGIGRTPPPGMGSSRPPSKGLIVRLDACGCSDLNVIISKGSANEWISGVTQSDKKMVLAGSYWGETGVFGVVGRYDENGEPDSEFGINNDGMVSFPSSGMSRVIALQKDGSILVGGSISNDGIAIPAVLRFLG
jgi:uncharacterized delta-60 repeat protein